MKFPVYYCYYGYCPYISHEYKEVWNEDQLAEAQAEIKARKEGFITDSFAKASYWYND